MISNITKTNLIKFWICIIIISFGTSPAFALDSSNMNLLLIGIMLMSPVILLISIKSMTIEDMLLILFMLSIIFSPLLNHPETMRWSTVIYSSMFIVSFITYKQLLYKDVFKIEDFEKLIRYLIYAYALVLIIQQLCVLLGLPIFNLSNYNPAEPWKLNSLTSEPSHSARIMGLLMFSFILIKQSILNRKYSFSMDSKSDRIVWVSFFWTMITMNSGTAFLFIIIIFSLFLNFKNILALIFSIFLVTILINFLDITSFERTFKIIEATTTFNINEIIRADPSAATRIIPMMLLSQLADISSVNGWFGHGIDHVSTILNNLVYIGGMPDNWSGGGMFLIWIEYGFLSFFLFTIISFISIFDKKNLFTIVFWFFLVFMYGVNSQIVWITIILLFTIKYFKKKRESVRK